MTTEAEEYNRMRREIFEEEWDEAAEDAASTVIQILIRYPEMSIQEAYEKLDDPEFLLSLLKD